MKLTKQQLKQLIKEEVTAAPELLDAIENLSDRIEGLDVSIDFLASAFIGVPASSIQGSQTAIGRGAYVPKIKFGGSEANVNEIKNMIREELEVFLKENRNES